MAKKKTENVSGATAAAKPRFTLKPSRQTCLGMASVIGVVVIASIGLYVWQAGELTQMETKVRAREGEVDSGQRIARRLERVVEQYNETQSQLRFLETSVTAGEYVPTLLRQTESLAKSVNLKVISVRPTFEPAPKPPATKEERAKFKPQPYDRIHIDMQVRGGYWNVAKLLYRLTEFPKILAVEGVQVQTQGLVATNRAPSLSVNLKLTGFIFPNDGKEAQALPASADPAPGIGGEPLKSDSATENGAAPPQKSASASDRAKG